VLSGPRARYGYVVRFVRVTLGLVLGAAALAGCAAISGLSDLEKVDCTDNCEGGVDGTAAADSGDESIVNPLPDVAVDSDDGGNTDSAGCGTCSGSTPVCDPSTNACVACLSNGDCGPGTICVNKSCVPGCAPDHTSCGADGGDCDIDAGVCRQCLTDTDCSGATPRCDTGTFTCVVCLPTNDNCPAGKICVKNGPGQFACMPGCKTVADCFGDGGVPDGGAGVTACCNKVCINTSVNQANCGGCGSACGADGGPATSCCSSTCHDEKSDPDNCGGCAVACSNNHMSTRTCGNGVCNGSCAPGYTDCDNNKQTDGCEINTAGDPNNCGACGTVCSNNNMATRTCNGTCNGTCSPGFADCNNNKQSDGCEVSTSTTNNCTGCGLTCDSTHSTPSGCTGATCTYSGCASGYMNCNSTPPDLNGCETNINNDVNNCGGCGQACDATHSTGAVCVNGKCQYGGCASGWGDCDGDVTGQNLNGCETPTTTVSNCAGCGNVCDTTHSNGRGCNGTTCTYTSCASGYINCDTSGVDANGCETPSTTTNNCGTCNHVCTNQSCNNGTCVACAAGKQDCNGSIAPDSDGCECNTATLATQGTVGGCCGTGCQIQHLNGYAGNFYDCAALSTYNQTQATEAATSDTTHAGTITSGMCGSPPNTQSAVFKTTGNGTTGVCTSWVFAGTGTFNSVNLANTVGTVYTSTGASGDSGCFCSLGTTPQWK
jgi:hypothetical protein